MRCSIILYANRHRHQEFEYDYDGLGRRIGKAVDDNGNGTVDRGERYVYADCGKTDPATGVALVFDLSGNLLHRHRSGLRR